MNSTPSPSSVPRPGPGARRLASFLLRNVLLVFVVFGQVQPARAQAVPGQSATPLIPLPVPAQATAGAATVNGPTNGPINLSLNVGIPKEPRDVDVTIRIVVVMTLLALAPSLVILMTAFTRTVIVLSFLRTALSVQTVVSGQLMTAFSLILTFFIMGPVVTRLETQVLTPYRRSEINGEIALERAGQEFRTFMLRQARARDVEFFVGLSGIGPTQVQDLPLRVVVPAFVISELRTGFQMGFMLFLPFILIDFVVAIILMSLGLMFLPPATISMPLKILLFVLVDGWALVVKAIVLSFTR